MASEVRGSAVQFVAIGLLLVINAMLVGLNLSKQYDFGASDGGTSIEAPAVPSDGVPVDEVPVEGVPVDGVVDEVPVDDGDELGYGLLVIPSS